MNIFTKKLTLFVAFATFALPAFSAEQEIEIKRAARLCCVTCIALSSSIVLFSLDNRFQSRERYAASLATCCGCAAGMTLPAACISCTKVVVKALAPQQVMRATPATEPTRAQTLSQAKLQ